MANLTLKQLREAQKANPPTLDETGEFIVEMARETILRIVSEPCPPADPGTLYPPAPAAGPSPAGSLPLQASPPVPAAASGGGLSYGAGLNPAGTHVVGYTRIFPATFPSISAIPQAWKDEFWSCNSQWCHVEGTVPHPDFEANLAAIEQIYTEK